MPAPLPPDSETQLATPTTRAGRLARRWSNWAANLFVSGPITDETITALAEVLSPGDLVVDGGNSKYTEDGPHAELLAAEQVDALPGMAQRRHHAVAQPPAEAVVRDVDDRRRGGSGIGRRERIASRWVGVDVVDVVPAVVVMQFEILVELPGPLEDRDYIGQPTVGAGSIDDLVGIAGDVL